LGSSNQRHRQATGASKTALSKQVQHVWARSMRAILGSQIQKWGHPLMVMGFWSIFSTAEPADEVQLKENGKRLRQEGQVHTDINA